MATIQFVTKVFGFPILLVGIAALGFAGQAQAQVFVLDFEGLGDGEPIEQFYNGGTGGGGSAGGSNFGVEFSINSLAAIDSDAGGSGNFANEPSPDTAMGFLQGTAIMNVAAGFTTGFSFFYTSVEEPGFVTVWDGLDGNGTMLAMINLPALGSDPLGGDPNGTFNIWAAIGVAFAGTAMSIDFGGAVNQIGYDDVTFGSATPGTPSTSVPEPSSLLLLGLGLSCWSLARRRNWLS